MIWPMGLVQTLLPPPCWQRLCDRSFYLCIILWAGLVKSDEPISLKLGVVIEPNLINWLTFGAAPVSDTDSASVFHFPQHCRIVDLRRFISISRADHQPIFTKLGKMTRTRQWIHYIFPEVRHTSRSRLIRQCGLEYQITLGWNVGRHCRRLVVCEHSLVNDALTRCSSKSCWVHAPVSTRRQRHTTCQDGSKCHRQIRVWSLLSSLLDDRLFSSSLYSKHLCVFGLHVAIYI